MTVHPLTNKIYQSMLSFVTEEGINASGKEEIYGCIFGRDSFITILKLLKTCENEKAKSIFNIENFKQVCRRALLTLTSLQGRETNGESGEEPGKFIHEYRKERFEHLVNRPIHPWYLYPDKIMRNYDSLDSTPLGLIAIEKYWKLTKDSEFLLKVLPSVEAALNWIITYADRDKDQLLEYELPYNRIHGGLRVQSWTDSHESLLRQDGSFPHYPIAPVEVQGYAWLALNLWADFYQDKNNFSHSEKFAQKLRMHAKEMKKRFNNAFLLKSQGMVFPAQALDGLKNQINTVTGNPLLLLWATYNPHGKPEAIIQDEYIPDLVQRTFMPDLFDPEAGIRTMSSTSVTFNSSQNSYHNGSFWPKLNGMNHEGLVNWGYNNEAELLKRATLKPIEHFGTPIELYIRTSEGKYLPYCNPQGREGCKEQAWSAAVALDLLTL